MITTLGTLVHTDMLGTDVPSRIEIDFGAQIFYWNEEQGCFVDCDGAYLYIEPDDADGRISKDSYYELP